MASRRAPILETGSLSSGTSSDPEGMLWPARPSRGRLPYWSARGVRERAPAASFWVPVGPRSLLETRLQALGARAGSREDRPPWGRGERGRPSKGSSTTAPILVVVAAPAHSRPLAQATLFLRHRPLRCGSGGAVPGGVHRRASYAGREQKSPWAAMTWMWGLA